MRFLSTGLSSVNFPQYWDFDTCNTIFLRSELSYDEGYKDVHVVGPTLKFASGSGLGGCTPSYILHTCAFGPIYWGGYLPCKMDYKVMVFYM